AEPGEVRRYGEELLAVAVEEEKPVGREQADHGGDGDPMPRDEARQAGGSIFDAISVHRSEVGTLGSGGDCRAATPPVRPPGRRGGPRRWLRRRAPESSGGESSPREMRRRR